MRLLTLSLRPPCAPRVWAAGPPCAWSWPALRSSTVHCSRTSPSGQPRPLLAGVARHCVALTARGAAPGSAGIVPAPSAPVAPLLHHADDGGRAARTPRAAAGTGEAGQHQRSLFCAAPSPGLTRPMECPLQHARHV